MANTRIEWTDVTWNLVVGCSIISSGCLNCYAMRMAWRLEKMRIKKYEGLVNKIKNKIIWNGLIKEDQASLYLPYRWKKPRKIFVNSMGDLFHPSVNNDFIRKVWQVMEETPQHYYQILTKRPKKMAIFINNLNKILPNVWLGTSVESARVNNRIDILRNIPAAIRYISFEPLIASVGQSVNLENIQWAIVGGESGPMARLMKKEWIDHIYDSCRSYNTAFFFKQWGKTNKDNRVYRGNIWNEMPVCFN